MCLCLASQNPFEWEFFVPARTDLDVKLLTAKSVLPGGNKKLPLGRLFAS